MKFGRTNQNRTVLTKYEMLSRSAVYLHSINGDYFM